MACAADTLNVFRRSIRCIGDCAERVARGEAETICGEPDANSIEYRNMRRIASAWQSRRVA